MDVWRGLVLRNEEIGRDPSALNMFLDEHAVTVVDLPTAYWHEWARELDIRATSTPSCLRLVIVGARRIIDFVIPESVRPRERPTTY